MARLDQPEGGSEQTPRRNKALAQTNRLIRKHEENEIRGQHSRSNLEIPENSVKEERKGKGLATLFLFNKENLTYVSLRIDRTKDRGIGKKDPLVPVKAPKVRRD